MLDAINRMLQPIYNRMNLMIGRAVIAAVQNKGGILLFDVKGLPLEEITDLDSYSHHGLISTPPVGAKLAVIFPGGNRSNGMAIAVKVEAIPSDAQNAEAGLYCGAGSFIIIAPDGSIRIKGGETSVDCTKLTATVTGTAEVKAGEIKATSSGNVTVSGNSVSVTSGGAVTISAASSITLTTPVVNAPMINAAGINLVPSAAGVTPSLTGTANIELSGTIRASNLTATGNIRGASIRTTSGKDLDSHTHSYTDNGAGMTTGGAN
ncbi:MAG: phage baseplate assembly protein [Alphaproteobacteria bacterium]|nr:phage baseplate assembly protein [Alphaproteobacteria bacterium]